MDVPVTTPVTNPVTTTNRAYNIPLWIPQHISKGKSIHISINEKGRIVAATKGEEQKGEEVVEGEKVKGEEHSSYVACSSCDKRHRMLSSRTSTLQYLAINREQCTLSDDDILCFEERHRDPEFLRDTDVALTLKVSSFCSRECISLSSEPHFCVACYTYIPSENINDYRYDVYFKTWDSAVMKIICSNDCKDKLFKEDRKDEELKLHAQCINCRAISKRKNKSMPRCPCKKAFFCDKFCQKQAWPFHKLTCSFRGEAAKVRPSE